MRQTRRNVEIKGRVGELTYEASKVSSGSPEQSETERDEDFTLKGIAALTTDSGVRAPTEESKEDEGEVAVFQMIDEESQKRIVERV